VGRAHLSALLADNHFEIASIVPSGRPLENLGLESDELSTATQAWARLVGSARICRSLPEILARGDRPDLAVVLTPTPQHYDDICWLLENDLHVVVEKPAAESAPLVARLRELATARGKSVFVVNNYAGYPAVIAFRQLCRQGFVGKILAVRAEMLQDTFVRMEGGAHTTIQGWRKVDYDIPTVSLDLGIHLLHLTGYLLDELPPCTVSYATRSGYPNGAITSVSMSGLLPSGGRYSAEFGKDYLGSRNGLRFSVFGSSGSIQWSQDSADSLVVSDGTSAKRVLDLHSLKEFVPQLTELERFKPGHPVGFVEALSNFYLGVSSSLRGQSNLASDIPYSLDATFDCMELLQRPFQDR
jgi:predicted dehydrogenase